MNTMSILSSIVGDLTLVKIVRWFTCTSLTRHRTRIGEQTEHILRKGLITVRVCSSSLRSGCQPAVRSFVVLSHSRFGELLKCNTEPPDVTKKEDGEIPLFLSHAVLSPCSCGELLFLEGGPKISGLFAGFRAMAGAVW